VENKNKRAAEEIMRMQINDTQKLNDKEIELLEEQ
jgi:hypothetical protein